MSNLSAGDLFNFSPLHNAVLMRRSRLVERYCLVLKALGRPLDVANHQGSVSDAVDVEHL